jgi:hypothetical protein
MSQPNGFDLLDPTGMLKKMRDTSMDAWSKMMIDFVQTETYAQATGQMLDTWLATSQPFRKALESSMARVLAEVNLPSREDITRMAERLTNIELRLDDMEAKLDELHHAAPVGRRARKANSTEGQP